MSFTSCYVLFCKETKQFPICDFKSNYWRKLTDPFWDHACFSKVTNNILKNVCPFFWHQWMPTTSAALVSGSHGAWEQKCSLCKSQNLRRVYSESWKNNADNSWTKAFFLVQSKIFLENLIHTSHLVLSTVNDWQEGREILKHFSRKEWTFSDKLTPSL